MNKPLIGVVPLWDNEKQSLWIVPGYMNGITNAGGIPVMLPLVTDEASIRQLANKMDGFLFTGGQDVNPHLYGEIPIAECGTPCEDRDTMERLLLEIAVLEKDKPAFGICRGIQFWNAALGGMMYQDLPTQYKSHVIHQMTPPYDRVVHSVSIAANTPLYDILHENEISVNSYHHQAIHTLADKLTTAAVSEDGLTEGVYIADRKFAIAVQWHPEYALHDENSQKLFAAFIRAAVEKKTTL